MAAGSPLSRRALLVVGLAGVLSGCGIHREDHAPELPLIPTREVDPRAHVLYAEYLRVRAAHRSAITTDPTWSPSVSALAARLAPLHAQQADVLAARIRELGEDPDQPTRLATATPSTTAGTGATQTGPSTLAATPASPTRAGATPTGPTGATPTGGAASGSDTSGGVVPLAVAEAAGLDSSGLAELATWPATEAPLLLSLLVQRASAVVELGAGALTLPEPRTASKAEAGRLLEAAAATTYALEVAAARVGPDDRPALSAALGAHDEVRRQLYVLAGSAAAPPAGGYVLPFPVTDAASARRLAATVLAAFTDALVAGVAAAVGHADAMQTLLGWASRAQTAAHGLGAPMRAFPGLAAR